jgi:hypothetical protein
MKPSRSWLAALYRNGWTQARIGQLYDARQTRVSEWMREAGLKASHKRGPKRRSRAALSEAFWGKVKRGSPEECWPWKGARNPAGYGKILVDGVHIDTHRVAYMLAVGPIGELLVCHKCDNPPCCNPQHLWLGTCSDNLRDAVAKGRMGRKRVG